jgi:exodeoxyribonuclease VII large subunit
MPGFWDEYGKTTRRRREPDLPASRDEPDDVSTFAKRIKGVLTSGLPRPCRVRGEIGRWQKAASGHRYFTLKDDRATLDCKMWRSRAGSLAFEPQEGQEVVVAGEPDFYAPTGRLSLTVDELEPVGAGALELAFRQLVERLRGEGLFDQSRKRSGPDYPQTVAIVTSPNAAGYADVLRVLAPHQAIRRLLVPVPVQGDRAAPALTRAVQVLSEQSRDVGGIDLVLLIRGGGSREDLWAFNDEELALAIVASPIPIVTGVGHETDTSVADLAADVHAHTPTQAAQYVVRHWRSARDRVEQLGIVLRREARRGVQESRREVRAVATHEAFRRPTDQVDRRRQVLDDAQANLAAAFRGIARQTRGRLRRVESILLLRHPRHVAAEHRLSLQRAHEQLRRAVDVKPRQTHLVQLARQLASVSPRRRLSADRQRLRDMHRRMLLQRSRVAQAASQQLITTASRFDQRLLLRLLQARRERLQLAEDRLRRVMQQIVPVARQTLDARDRQLRALGPEQVLQRGYSITTRTRDGRVVRSAADAPPGEPLQIRLANGDLSATSGNERQMPLFDDAG